MNNCFIENKEITLKEIHNFKGKYPRQLSYLFFIEMLECFYFFGMRSVLTLFMVSKLGISDKYANLRYGAIQAFIYTFTFISGNIVDKILIFKKSLFFGGLVMIAGNFMIVLSPHDLFYIGITLTIIGTDFIKPNISSMVGELYKDGDPRRDAALGIFYSWINLGIFLGGILCVYLGKYYSCNLCFSITTFVMTLGMLIFMLTKKYLGPIGESQLLGLSSSSRKKCELLVYMGVVLCIPIIYTSIHNTKYTNYFMYTIGPLSVIYFVIEMIKSHNYNYQKKLIAAMILILFFAFFEHSGSALAIFTRDNLNHESFFFKIDPNIVNNSSKALFVIILSFILGLFWLCMAKRNIEPNIVVKFELGFIILSGSFYVLYISRFFANAQEITSLNIFTLAYKVMTFGELGLSPKGLSIITILTPENLSGMKMGMWFLASTYGQYVAVVLGAGISSSKENSKLEEKLESYTSGFGQLADYR